MLPSTFFDRPDKGALEKKLEAKVPIACQLDSQHGWEGGRMSRPNVTQEVEHRECIHFGSTTIVNLRTQKNSRRLSLLYRRAFEAGRMTCRSEQCRIKRLHSRPSSATWSCWVATRIE